MELTPDLAYLIGFACEAVLYGVNCVLFVTSIVILFKQGGRRGLNVLLVVTNIFLFLGCTTHFGIQFNHYYTTLGSTGVTGYANETLPMFGGDILMSVIDFVGELILCYRCWVVWGRSYPIVVLPFLTSLSGLACICGLAHLVLTTVPTAPAPPPALARLGLAGYVLALCTNVLITALIVGRVWYVSRRCRGVIVGASGTAKAISVLVESGAIYLVVQLPYVTLFALGLPAEQIAGLAAVQIYGIAPTLITIRVYLGLSDQFTSGLDMTNMSFRAHQPEREVGLSTTHVASSAEDLGGGWIVKGDVELLPHKDSRGSDAASSSVIPV